VTASARLTELLTPVVADAGYDLEDLGVTAAGKRSVVRVLVDRDGGITLDDVADVSRVISDALDAADEQDPSLLGPSYVLEVSSPGVDRPLTAPRHWRRNAGRLVTVHPVEGPTYDARITSADDEAVVLDVGGDERVAPYATLAKGVVQVEFNRPGAPVVDDEDEEDEL
jgi:ribosome maturation factor RimP